MKKPFYRLPSNRSSARLFSILAFAALASWLAPAPVAGYTVCQHRTSVPSGTIIGYHCPPCSGNTTHGSTPGKDTTTTKLGSTCGGSSINASLRMSHTETEYQCRTSEEGRGAIVEDADAPDTLTWDFGITDPADLVMCEQFIKGVPTGQSGLFRIEGIAAGLTSTCTPVNEGPIQSRRTYTGFCNKDQTTTVLQTITFADIGNRPTWCPSGTCQNVTVGPPDGLPTNTGGNTTEKLCADAFLQESPGTLGRLASKQMVVYSIGFASNDCSGEGEETHAMGETFRARGCQNESWDPLTATISGQDCVLTISGKAHTHLASDTGSGVNECGPGSGVVKESFEQQTCKTSGLVKYRCFSRPDTGEVPGFDTRVVNLAAKTATLNGVLNDRRGTFNASQGMVEFSFPQCAVAANTTVENGVADLFFKAKTQPDGFAVDSDTVDTH